MAYIFKCIELLLKHYASLKSKAMQVCLKIRKKQKEETGITHNYNTWK